MSYSGHWRPLSPYVALFYLHLPACLALRLDLPAASTRTAGTRVLNSISYPLANYLVHQGPHPLEQFTQTLPLTTTYSWAATKFNSLFCLSVCSIAHAKQWGYFVCTVCGCLWEYPVYSVVMALSDGGYAYREGGRGREGGRKGGRERDPLLIGWDLGISLLRWKCFSSRVKLMALALEILIWWCNSDSCMYRTACDIDN